MIATRKAMAEKKATPKRFTAVKYMLFGAAFGYIFPIVATLLRINTLGLPFNMASIITIHRTDNLLWVINTAPLFLGLFAYLVGARQDALLNSNEELKNQRQELEQVTATLEQRVEERTRQVRIATEIAQRVSASFSLDDLLNTTVNLIVDKFGYYHAGLFLLDETGRYLVLRAARGPSAEKMLANAHRLAVGSPSIMGYVAATRQPRLASNVSEDTIHLKNELLPETQAEVGVPIIGETGVLGALDVQSTTVDAFDDATILMLQALASQIAAAIMNVRTLETTQVNLQHANEVTLSSHLISAAKTEEETYQATRRVLKNIPDTTLLMLREHAGFRLIVSDPNAPANLAQIPDWIQASDDNLAAQFSTGIITGEVSTLSFLPAPILQIFQQLKILNVGLLPVLRGDQLASILAIGSREKQAILPISIQQYASVAELATSTLERIRAERMVANRLGELEAITVTSQAISATSDLQALYHILHDHIRQKMGDINFLVAIYEQATNSIHIPYLYEKGQDISSLETFPLGEGLTSILIRSKHPLMIVEDTERRAVALGAKVVGQPAKSWLGTPLIVTGEVLGALIVQDVEHENAFAESDLHFMVTLSAQVAGAIFNTRLLQETRKRTVQLQTASEIARDISGSLDVGELLAKAVSLIRERFHYYHAGVFLLDANGEYAVIREATGDAGLQMKVGGHKLKVGSNSIVGYVTSRGEPLVVNDTNHEATYYANPLLPDTRSEVAIPLKVGERILGALDVQSNEPFSFAEEDITVLRILADQMAIAVITSELFAETQEHLSQHRLLHHVTTAAASGTTLEEALHGAAQGLQVTLGGDRVAILLANREKEVLEVKAVAGYSEEVKQIRIKYGEGITGWVATHQRPLRVDDVTKDSRYVQVGGNVRSELAIPMVYRGELLGVLNVESDQVGAHSENDEELLGTLGGSLAAIIANARLLEQIRQQVDRERLVYEVTSKIRRSTDMQTIMATTASELSKALGARRVKIKLSPASDQDPSSAQTGPGK
jgi:GAF domain-containing protein